MIEAKQITNTMYTFSGRLFGYTNDDVDSLQEQIQWDLKSNLSDIILLNVKIHLEPVEDLRSLHQCYLINIQMLISFKQKSVETYDVIWLITNYLEHLLSKI